MKSDQCSAVGLVQAEKNTVKKRAKIKNDDVRFFWVATVDRIICLLGMGYYHSLIVLRPFCSDFQLFKVKTFR